MADSFILEQEFIDQTGQRMDYQIIVTAAGKSHFVANDCRNRKQIIRTERIVTFTGMQSPNMRHKRQQLFLTLASPLVK